MDGVDSASRLSMEQPARENCHISDELKSGKCILFRCCSLVNNISYLLVRVSWVKISQWRQGFGVSAKYTGISSFDEK